jgi:hypothetical protein
MPCASPALYLRRIDRILQDKSHQHLSIHINPQLGHFLAKSPIRRLVKHTTNEKRISRKDYLVLAILHKIADAILRVARGMQGRHGDAVSNLEYLAVRGGPRDGLTLLAADYGDFEGFELSLSVSCLLLERLHSTYYFLVSTGVVPVANRGVRLVMLCLLA